MNIQNSNNPVELTPIQPPENIELTPIQPPRDTTDLIGIRPIGLTPEQMIEAGEQLAILLKKIEAENDSTADLSIINDLLKCLMEAAENLQKFAMAKLKEVDVLTKEIDAYIDKQDIKLFKAGDPGFIGTDDDKAKDLRQVVNIEITTLIDDLKTSRENAAKRSQSTMNDVNTANQLKSEFEEKFTAFLQQLSTCATTIIQSR